METLEHLINSAVSMTVALGGRGILGKMWAGRVQRKKDQEEALVSEVRAHGLTRAEKSRLEARVADLERRNDEMASTLINERVQWEKERSELNIRIEALEKLVLRGS